MAIQKITPFLWYDKNAEEAVKLYTSVFKNSKIGAITHYGKEGFEVHGMPEGTAFVIEFELDGMQFQAMNAGPIFKFTEAISFVVTCETQEEIDYYWEKLSAVPESEQCGWLKDKFGLSWQITPAGMSKLMNDSDKAKSGRVMNAVLKMKKIDIAELERAAAGN